ncbi:retrovirus-related pol polyprotein from transposon TNT 1-94 [Tanacetum coccineum]
MTSLADKSLLSGGDNKPPMLEKHLYDSWKSRMELYMMNRPHGRMILASVEKGPLVWPSITEDGVTRLKEYVELTPAEAIQRLPTSKQLTSFSKAYQLKLCIRESTSPCSKGSMEKIKLLMPRNIITQTRTATVQGNKLLMLAGLPQENYTPGASGSNTGKTRTYYICYNCKGEGHIAKQCTKPKRKRDDTWFNDKVLLVQAQAGGQALTEEEIAFLADPGLPDIQTTQTVITHNAAYQADDLDAYDSNCDGPQSAKIAPHGQSSRNGSDALH